jgi:hypothetical protein
MKNIRILQPKRLDLVQNDWSVVTADQADFAFRVWGGNTEYPHLKPTRNVQYATGLSSNSWLFIKSNADWVYDLFDSFNQQRMFQDRVGGANNPGGNVFGLKQVTEEYLLCREEQEIQGLSGWFEEEV